MIHILIYVNMMKRNSRVMLIVILGVELYGWWILEIQFI